MMRIGILLFDDVEVLDFAGPFEVLAGVSAGGTPLFSVFTVAPAKRVTCRGGLRVEADHDFSDSPPMDMLVVPGGPGARGTAAELAPLAAFVREQASKCRYVASVCTGAYILAEAGLLAGRPATTHCSRLDDFRRRFPGVKLLAERVVDDDTVITAAGVSSGVDLALHVVARFGSAEIAAAERQRIEWPTAWNR
ncbi:MAG: DJ-1/PfpI family protein [Chloroflexota bacterium]